MLGVRLFFDGLVVGVINAVYELLLALDRHFPTVLGLKPLDVSYIDQFELVVVVRARFVPRVLYDAQLVFQFFEPVTRSMITADWSCSSSSSLM